LISGGPGEWILVDHPILTSLIVIVLTVLSAVMILVRTYRKFPGNPFMPTVATVSVNLVLVILVGVFLNYIFAASRDREQRRWTLRQEHLTRLRPVLQKESRALLNVAEQFRISGRLIVSDDATEIETQKNVLFYPEVLSRDLPNHYREYSQRKEDLIVKIEPHDAEARVTSMLLHKHASRVAERWRDQFVEALLQKCLRKGPGMVLSEGVDTSTVFFPRQGGSGPSLELQGVFQAFQSFQPDTEITAHCERLISAATSIESAARSLSGEALRLAESTTLSGECEYIRLD
jgi:hypothetical protein